MPRVDRRALIEEARSALATVPPEPDDPDAVEQRERLDDLINDLEDGVLSPLVLETVATRARPRLLL
jgi:hypothetical protein